MADTIRDMQLLVEIRAETQRQLVAAMREVSHSLVESAITALTTERRELDGKLIRGALFSGLAAVAHDAAIHDACAQLRQVHVLDGTGRRSRAEDGMATLLWVSNRIAAIPYEVVVLTRQAIRDGSGNAPLFRAACRAAAIHDDLWASVEIARRSIRRKEGES